jgi:hypothetical protein
MRHSSSRYRLDYYSPKTTGPAWSVGKGASHEPTTVINGSTVEIQGECHRNSKQCESNERYIQRKHNKYSKTAAMII